MANSRGGARSDVAKQEQPASPDVLEVDTGPQDPDIFDESLPFEDDPPSPVLDPADVLPVLNHPQHQSTLTALPPAAATR